MLKSGKLISGLALAVTLAMPSAAVAQSVNSGDCSTIATNPQIAGVGNAASNTGDNVGIGIGNDPSSDTDTNQGSSAFQSSNTSPDCSTVINRNGERVVVRQVKTTPKGAVKAGAGGADLGALLGLGGSLAASGYAALRLRRSL